MSTPSELEAKFASIATSLTAHLMRVDAQLEALRRFSARLATKCGMSESAAIALIHELGEIAHERRMIELEDRDPGAAAWLDLRKMPDGSAPDAPKQP
jgi:hypothetical protein